MMIRIFLNGKMCNVGSSSLLVKSEKWENKHYRMKTKFTEALNFGNVLDWDMTTNKCDKSLFFSCSRRLICANSVTLWVDFVLFISLESLKRGEVNSS